MEWNIDVHKFLSEITRTALKVIADFGVTSASDNELITKAEHRMAELGVYKSEEAAEGRVRRALFTYFKNYNLMYDDTSLTPIGEIFRDDRISIKEFAFYYLANYKHQVSKDEEYYPLQLIIKCLKEKQSHSSAEGIITSYDFSRLVLCKKLDDINDSFIEDLVSNSGVILDDSEKRSVGFDVWQNLLCSAGLFVKEDKNSMIPSNNELIDWIYDAYSKKHPSVEGEIITGILHELPLLNIDSQKISPHSKIWDESNALQAYLFDSVNDEIISKYIYKSDASTFNGCWDSLGIAQYRGAFKLFSGFERLVGYRLYNSTDTKVKNIGRILINSIAPKTPLELDVQTPTILYGPPGTGKTYKLQTEYISKFSEYFVTTFHQSFSYEEFVEGLKPILDDSSKEVRYKIEKGIFYQACEKAAEMAGYSSFEDCLKDTRSGRNIRFNKAIEEKKTVLLCIDEINRGNVASIFGDLISLIEPSKRLGAGELEMTAILPYSKTPFGVPANLFIVGTMNTADRSIQLLDSALRRRFKFEELQPKYEVIKDTNARMVLKTINARVRCLLNKDNQIGHSYLMFANSSCDILSALYNKIIPLLEEYFYNDINKVRFVLNDNANGLFYVEDSEAKAAYKVFQNEEIDDEDRNFFELNPAIADAIDSKDEIECAKYLVNLLPKKE